MTLFQVVVNGRVLGMMIESLAHRVALEHCTMKGDCAEVSEYHNYYNDADFGWYDDSKSAVNYFHNGSAVIRWEDPGYPSQDRKVQGKANAPDKGLSTAISQFGYYRSEGAGQRQTCFLKRSVNRAMRRVGKRLAQEDMQ
jgi:hypothetical protein